MKNQLNLLPYLVLAILLFISVESIAQVPQKFSSQIVVRNASNELIVEDVVRIRVSILQGAPDGTLSYSEVHLPFTNANGLASTEIGTGTIVTGTFSDIDWNLGPYFIQTEVDPTGGTNYTVNGTTELLSVPYALHAGSDDDWEVSGSDVFVPSGMKVGIGTSSPDVTLDVLGDALINGLTIGRGSGNDYQSTAIGDNALINNWLGNKNTAVGAGALGANDIGSENTAIGWGALGSNVGGSLNTAVGYFANVGSGNLTGATAIGSFATVSQSNSIVLGNGGTNVGVGVSAPNEKLEVGGDGRAFFGDGEGEDRKGLLIDGIQGENAARIEAFDYGAGIGIDLVLNSSNTSGNVGIRRNDPSVALDVLGSIEYTGTISDVSDERQKENFEHIENAVESISQIQGYSYNMKNDTAIREYGVVAQDVQKVFPEMVTVVDEENGYFGVSYVQLIPVLLEAIKELKEENDALRASNGAQAIENAQLTNSHALLQEKVKENNDSIQELKNILNSLAKK